MAYAKHKPQYRNVRTTNAASIGRPRDIRRRLPDARGKVLLPDNSGLPRKYPAFNRTPRAKPAFGRFAFSASVQKSGKASFWYRGSPANLGRVAGGMAAVMAAWELYDYVNNLSGDVYMKPGGKLGGGPSAMDYSFVDETTIAPDVAVVPAPGPEPGWTFSYSQRYFYGLFGNRVWYSVVDHHGRPLLVS